MDTRRDRQTLEVRNPATGQPVGSVPVATPEEVAAAADKAREAQRRWGALSVVERARIVRRFHDRILKDGDRILDLIQSESGKARRDALAEIITTAGTARYYLNHAVDHLQPKRREAAVPAITSAEIEYKPHGVVGLITPWNYPFMMAIADAIPALLAGNAVIVKPSEVTPLSADLARQLFLECGLDGDLLVVLHGDGSLGQELIRHADYIGFTGGTQTGRKVALAAADRLIPFSLELGGKNAMVVLDGAPLDEVTTSLLAGAFSNSGQSCISIERVYVEERLYEPFARRMAEKTAALKLGWSPSWDIDMGSMISADHARKVRGHIESAVAAGAGVIAGGKERRDLGPSFVEPTILSGVNAGMPVFANETFGPVVSIYPVAGAEEAIRLANASEFGLNASVWAGEKSTAQAVARRLETGSAVINSTLLIYNSFDVPMGGVKLSGIGRRHGEQGILRYTQAQSIVSSVATGGGYDSMLTRVRSERVARMMVSALKLWRRLGI